ncbi:hypothetical protein I6F35_13925 [Bradyrhizobium sp. BRP22]|uniref:hypothetical protein n=1 Tax=Bradyrhizobium sp. BRP22 TaxID=2793821 RepID=UPI001CD4365C|nr:hypothetical protein [Bradyrhizobium sp. BRP22]MCA1454307.1 hypothetical protein [Bradyrhizobium sp. BRP22]
MRAFLALGLLIGLSASASAATMHHHFEQRHVIVQPGPVYAGPGWAVEAHRSPMHLDDTPSYDDPSKFGGGTAL